MRALSTLALGLGLVFASLAQAEESYPNLVGTWSGTGDGVFVTAPGPQTDETYRTIDITLVVVRQEERRSPHWPRRAGALACPAWAWQSASARARKSSAWRSSMVPSARMASVEGSRSAVLWKFDGAGRIAEERWHVDPEQWKAAF